MKWALKMVVNTDFPCFIGVYYVKINRIKCLLKTNEMSFGAATPTATERARERELC